MDRLDELERKTNDLARDFQRATKATVAMLSANEAQMDSLQEQAEAEKRRMTDELHKLDTAIQLLRQRAEDNLRLRSDATPLMVPLEPRAPAAPAAPAAEPHRPDVKDLARQWAPMVTSVGAIVLALVQQCSPPTVERTPDGHTRVIVPVNTTPRPQPPAAPEPEETP